MKHFSVGCNLEPQDLQDGLRLRRMGIEYYEVGNAVFIDENHARRIKQLLDDCGIIPWSAHGRYLDRESWPTLEGFEHDCRIAEIYGAKVIVTHSPSKLEGGAYDLERFSDAVQIASDHGLKMAVETSVHLRRLVCCLGYFSRFFRLLTEKIRYCVDICRYMSIYVVLCGFRTLCLDFRSGTDFGLFLSIFASFCGFLKEIIRHYVDICRFMSPSVDR